MTIPSLQSCILTWKFSKYYWNNGLQCNQNKISWCIFLHDSIKYWGHTRKIVIEESWNYILFDFANVNSPRFRLLKGVRQTCLGFNKKIKIKKTNMSGSATKNKDLSDYNLWKWCLAFSGSELQPHTCHDSIDCAYHNFMKLRSNNLAFGALP